MFKSYTDVRDWLENFIPLVWGKEELGLVRIEYLLKLLANPEKKFKSIHVAGTSGKGSTAFYTAELLQASLERKVGLHISPHLVDIRERMQINGELISVKKFIRLMEQVRGVVEKIKRLKPELTPSYFEILVAAAFVYFAQEKVHWAVVEVGLGGRLDGTNVLRAKVSVITNIGLDHTEILGKTIEKISYEKAGIIKRGTPVITGASGRALEVIADVAKVQQAPLITIDTQKNQDSNKFLALAAVKAAKVDVSEEAVEGAFEAKFAGRLEEIDDGVVLDGAHNPDKIKFLINFLRKFSARGSPIRVVLGFKKGKDWKRMLDLLIGNLPVEQVIATKFYATTDMGQYEAVEPENIASYIRLKWKVKVESLENSQEAVFEAVNRDKDLVLVTGSLYLVGEARTLWHLPEF